MEGFLTAFGMTIWSWRASITVDDMVVEGLRLLVDDLIVDAFPFAGRLLRLPGLDRGSERPRARKAGRTEDGGIPHCVRNDDVRVCWRGIELFAVTGSPGFKKKVQEKVAALGTVRVYKGAVLAVN